MSYLLLKDKPHCNIACISITSYLGGNETINATEYRPSALLGHQLLDYLVFEF